MLNLLPELPRLSAQDARGARAAKGAPVCRRRRETATRATAAAARAPRCARASSCTTRRRPSARSSPTRLRWPTTAAGRAATPRVKLLPRSTGAACSRARDVDARAARGATADAVARGRKLLRFLDAHAARLFEPPPRRRPAVWAGPSGPARPGGSGGPGPAPARPRRSSAALATRRASRCPRPARRVQGRAGRQEYLSLPASSPRLLGAGRACAGARRVPSCGVAPDGALPRRPRTTRLRVVAPARRGSRATAGAARRVPPGRRHVNAAELKDALG